LNPPVAENFIAAINNGDRPGGSSPVAEKKIVFIPAGGVTLREVAG
jgi:hypothetical protein